MVEYYISPESKKGFPGPSKKVIGDIKKARSLAYEMFLKSSRPIDSVSVGKLTNGGKGYTELGHVQRWGYYVDRYGIDRTDDYLCWVDANGVGHMLFWDGRIRSVR